MADGPVFGITSNVLVKRLVLQAIKEDVASVRPSVSECRQTADQLSTLCGSPSDVSVHKCISDLDTALSDIEEGLDDRELELNQMLQKAQQCTTCLDVCDALSHCLDTSAVVSCTFISISSLTLLIR